MTDLRTDTVGMTELLAHLRRREGAINYFYCDHRGLVTIAIGYLVDKAKGPESAGLRRARELAERADVSFTTKDGAPASSADVEADWRRVKAHGRDNPNLGARRYASVARLRVDDASVDAITSTVVRRFLDQLYERRPFLLEHDVHVAMALLDARYNPAGVRIFDELGPVAPLWHKLDPKDAAYDAAGAPDLFQQIWSNRANERYQERHAERVAWLREGLTEPPPVAPI